MTGQVKPDFRPQDTIAVVVGVEPYAVGERGRSSDQRWTRPRSWNGCAAGASRLGNIFPFISALERNRAEVEEGLVAAGVGVPAAGTEQLPRVVIQECRAL